MERDFDSRRLDGKLMITSVFFDRKVGNEDNSFFEKLELNGIADLKRNHNYYLPDLKP